MAKKTETKEVQNLKLDPAEYWEWRNSITVLQKASVEVKAAETEAKMISLEYQNKAMQLQLHNKTRLEAAKKGVENAKGDYESLKAKIEARLGTSLNGKAVDDFTFEVKDLPNQ